MATTSRPRLSVASTSTALAVTISLVFMVSVASVTTTTPTTATTNPLTSASAQTSTVPTNSSTIPTNSSTMPTNSSTMPTNSSTMPTNASVMLFSALRGSSLQDQILAAINAERAKVGSGLLCINTKLQAAAEGHSRYMAKWDISTHRGPYRGILRSHPSDRMSDQGYKWPVGAIVLNDGEILGCGQVSVAEVMNYWMSHSHTRIWLLNSRYKHFGMGYAYNSTNKYYKHHWTVDFANSPYESCQ